MAGIIVLSSSGAEARAAWWERLRAATSRWELILPTATQVALMRASYPFWAGTFEAISTLDELATRLSRGASWLSANLYLENFATASPDEIALLHRLGADRSVVVRVRDLVDVPAIEALFQPFVEALGSHPDWTGQQDGPPSDAAERQALAQHLFGAPGTPRPPRPARPGPRDVRLAQFDSRAAEIAAIGARVARLVSEGPYASIAVAVPDASTELALPSDVTLVRHADLAAWTGNHLFMAGLDDGSTALPTHFLDAVEGTVSTLWLSSSGPLAPDIADAVASLAPTAWEA